jgi:hypothetical protein
MNGLKFTLTLTTNRPLGEPSSPRPFPPATGGEGEEFFRVVLAKS